MAPLLKQVATLAIRFGISPRDISAAIKSECVHEAARFATLGNGRVNYSRVAVVTGLSRSAAKALLAPGTDDALTASPSTQRAWRLISAWMHDPRYLDRQKKPRVLPLKSHPNSFSELARTYCGDVPIRAVITELSRMGAIETSNSEVKLNRSLSRRVRREILDATELLRATGEVLEQIGKRSRDLSPKHRTATIAISNDADLALILRQIDSTLDAALNAIQALGKHPIIRGHRRRKSAKSVLDVTAIISTRVRTEE